MCWYLESLSFFFFNDTATTEIYTLSLHDALPIFDPRPGRQGDPGVHVGVWRNDQVHVALLFFRSLLVFEKEKRYMRSEEHTSELQSPCNLVCRLLLEKKKNQDDTTYHRTIQHEKY